MPATGRSPQPWWSNDPIAERLRMKFPVGARAPGVNVIHFRVVSGGAPDTVTIQDDDGNQIDMDDTNYSVFVQGETAGRVTVDESSKTIRSFDVLGGVAAEILYVLVIGRIAGQP